MRMGVKVFEASLFIGRESIMGEKQKVVIESIEACGNNLYVGTSDCFVHHFIMNLPKITRTKPSGISVSKKMKCQLAGKKPAIQIKAALCLNNLIANCDGNLVLLNISDLSINSSISNKIKNIKRFCINHNPISPKAFCVEICVSFTKKKALQIYQIYENQVILTKEISLSFYIETFAVDFNCALLSTQSSYVLLHIESGQKQELFSFGENPGEMHLVQSIENSEFLITAPGSLGMFVSADGTSNRPPMQWSEGIFMTTLVYPYIVAISSRMITIHNILDQQQKQSINFQGGSISVTCEHDYVLVCTAKDIFTLVPVPLEDQIKSLLSNQKIEEAISLVKSNEKKLSSYGFKVLIKRVYLMAGFQYFKILEFEEAKSCFEFGDLDPREVISLFPRLLRDASLFKRSIPPLNSIAGIEHMCEYDSAKVLACKQFLSNLLEASVVAALSCLRGLSSLPTYLEADTDEKSFKGFCCDLISASIINLSHLEENEKLQDLIEDKNLPSEVLCVVLQDDGNRLVEELEKHDCHHSLALMHLKCNNLNRSFEIFHLLATNKVVDSTFPGLLFVAEKIAEFCKDQKLFLHHVDWILRLDEDAGVKAFISHTEHHKDFSFSTDQIISFLHEYTEALTKFLHYVVVVMKSTQEKYHTHLVVLYLDKVLDLLKKGNSNETKVARNQLKYFLKSSNFYRVSMVLGKINEVHLYDEQVILLSKLGEHEKALDIILHQLNDPFAAESYCIENASDDEDKKTSCAGLFHILLSIHLKDLSNKHTNISVITTLLNKHAEHFKVENVLHLLPTHLSVGSLQHFLQTASRASDHQLRMKNIELMLLQAHLKDLQRESEKVHSNPVLLHEGKICSVCQNAIKDEPFSRYPNGIVVHLLCSRDKFVCPVTGKVFKLMIK